MATKKAAGPKKPKNNVTATLGRPGTVVLSRWPTEAEKTEEFRAAVDAARRGEPVSYTHLTLPTIYSV